MFVLQPQKNEFTAQNIGLHSSLLSTKCLQNVFISQANDIDLKDITREEAVLILLSLGEEVSLWVQHKKGGKPMFDS